MEIKPEITNKFWTQSLVVPEVFTIILVHIMHIVSPLFFKAY